MINKKLKLHLLALAIALTMFGCHCNTQQDTGITIIPDAGTTYKTGDNVAVKLSYAGIKPDSIVYLIDSVRVGSKKDSSAFLVKTDSMLFGPRLITAKVYQSGKSQELSTNIVLLPAKAPEEYTFKIERVFPHDTSCFTEGLLYQNGFLYESGGGYLIPPKGDEVLAQSSLRKVDLATGKAVQKIMVDPKVFAEGISIIGDKIVQLTYKEKIGYVYDKNSFKLLKTFTDNIGIEGWGMCFDGKKLYKDDKTNRLFFLDKDDYHQIGYVDVYDDKGAVNEINELEYIDGKIYANIWRTDTIVVINPKTGAVLQRIDMAGLYPASKRNPNADVLNGIAYDADQKRIFVTGKKWDKLFQVKFVKK
jgi:glutamine cyclotransferase